MVIFCVSRYESWKNRGKIVEKHLSSEFLSIQLNLKRKNDTKNVFHRGIAETLIHIRACGQALRRETGMIALPFRGFPRFFHDLRLKNGILAAAFEVEESSETQIQRWSVTSPPCNRPSITTYLRYRFPRHPSAFNGSPSAQGGRRHISSHSSSMEPKPSATSATSSSCTCRTTG